MSNAIDAREPSNLELDPVSNDAGNVLEASANDANSTLGALMETGPGDLNPPAYLAEGVYTITATLPGGSSYAIAASIKMGSPVLELASVGMGDSSATPETSETAEGAPTAPLTPSAPFAPSDPSTTSTQNAPSFADGSTSWIFTFNGFGYYQIVNVATGLALTALGNSQFPGDGVWLSAFGAGTSSVGIADADDAQLWSVAIFDNDTFFLTSKLSGLVLTLASSFDVATAQRPTSQGELAAPDPATISDMDPASLDPVAPGSADHTPVLSLRPLEDPAAQRWTLLPTAMNDVFLTTSLDVIPGALTNEQFNQLPSLITQTLPAITPSNAKPQPVPGPAPDLARYLNDLNMMSGAAELTLYNTPSITPADTAPTRLAIDHILASRAKVGFALLDLAAHQGASYNVDQMLYSASTIKAPYIVSLVMTDPKILDTWNDSIKKILRHSDNDEYKRLRRTFGNEVFRKFCLRCNVRPEIADRLYTSYTPRELAKLWAGMYDYVETSGDVGNRLKIEMNNPSYSAIKPVLGNVAFTISKGGWIASSAFYCVTNDSGVIYIHNGAYLLTILTSIPSKMKRLYELVGALNGLHDKMVTALLNA